MGKKRLSLFLAVAMLLSLLPQITLPAAAAERETLKFTQISAGAHTLALRDDGTVFAWGYNNYGQIGDGIQGTGDSATAKKYPIKINGFGGKKIKAVDAMYSNSVALAEDGTVWSWGNGEYSGLGVSTNVLTPTQITGLSGKNIVEINGCMALEANGTVWSWGYNGYAQLGTGSNTPSTSLIPVEATVLSGKNIKAIRGGECTTHAAIASDGTVWAWGSNQSKLLTNTANTFEATPVQITLPDRRAIKDIEIGSRASIYVLATDGTVWVKGDNSKGQLGIGSTASQTTFVQITSLSDVTKIAAGGDSSPFVIVLKSDGTFYSWGDNFRGKLGTENGISTNYPVKGFNPSGLLIKSLDCGSYHSAFLTTEGRVFSAGSESAIGNNTGTGSATPTEIFIPATSIKIDQQNVTFSNTYQLTATVEPAYASGKISWGANPFSVAAADASTGLLTGKTKGTAEVYVIITTNPAGDKRELDKTNVTVKARAGLAKYGGEGGEELFLHGEFLELGISKWGDFGTLGQKPAGFRGTNGSTRIGMSADHDGFNNGLDMPVDYYLPGCPEERFVVGYKDAEQKAYTNTNSAVMGDTNMTTDVTNLSKTADGLLKAKVVSTWAGVMEITQIIQFQDDEQFFRNEVTIKNLSANPLDSVRYMRTFDPDNTVFMGGSYVTENTILDNSADGKTGKAVVVAKTADDNDPLNQPTTLNTKAPIFYYSKDERAKVSAFGFTNKDPYYPLAYDNARPKDYSITTDGAISIAMDTGTILTGASSETFVYYTSLDKDAFSEVIKKIEKTEGIPPTNTNENPGTCTVTFQDINGNELTTALVVKGTSATTPEPPSLPGKEFLEWKVQGASTSTLEAVTEDMTVQAMYREGVTTSKVTFNSDGGSPVDPLYVTPNSLITEPAVPTKDGNTFKGWKKDGTLWKFASDTVSGNITLTADWAKNPSAFFRSAETIPDVTVDIGTPQKAALAKLPTSVEITDSKSFKHTVTEVKWEFNTVGGTYDPYQPGRYVAIGSFELPSGVAWENDHPVKLQGIVYIKDPAKRVTEIRIKDKTKTTIAYPYDLEHPLTLEAEILPAEASVTTYRWSSSDESVATIDQTGKITPLKGGTTTITVTSDDGGKTDSLAITVEKSNECDVLAWKTPDSPTIAADNAQKISKTVDNATDKLKVDVTVSPKASWKLYRDSTCTTEIANQDWALIYGDNTAYLKVTAEDGVATKTYTLTVTRPKLVVDATDLTSLITAPVKLDSPVTTPIHIAQYTSGDIAWKAEGGAAQTDPFAGKTVYVATVELTPTDAYTFTGFSGTFRYDGATKVEVAGDGATRTVTITFPSTEEKIRPYIAFAPTVASNELTYGEALSKLTWNNTPSAKKTMTSSVAVDGTFAWKDGTLIPDVPTAGTYAAEWIFTPTDTDNYVATKGIVAITVHPKELKIKGLTITDKFYDALPMATIAGTATLDGVLTADVPNVTLNKTNATAVFSDATVGEDKSITVSGYALGGSRAGNYALKQPEGLKASIKEDKTAPILTADVVSRASVTNASISFRADERGTYYYAIVASGETVPTVDTSGAGLQMLAGTNTISLTNLTSGAKTIYIKGKNATGLISTLLVMDIPNYSTGGGGGGGTSTSSGTSSSSSSLPTVVPPNVKIPVIIDGTTHNLGQAKTETNSQTKIKTTVVTVEEKAFNEQLAKAKESVIIPIPQMEGATANRSVLTAEMVDRAAEKKMVIDVQSKGVDYIIPATAVDVSTVASSLGIQKSELDDVQMDITITNLTEDAARFVSDAAKQGDFKLMLPPVEFKVTAVYGGKTVEVSNFNNYVERVIAIPSGVDPKRITTGVVVLADGTEYHVPTEVFQAKDGGYYARVHSRTNSVYALIWNEESFEDSVGTWYESVVAEMASRKIIKGRDEHCFDGNGSITRAEFAAIIVRGLGLPENGKSKFKDVSGNSWYYGAVGKAFEFGIIQGRNTETFDPGAKISREEVMAMLQRASVIAEFKGQEGNREEFLKQYKDHGMISAWAEKNVLFNVSNGLMKGYDGMLRPTDPISRAECATAVLRLLQKAELVDVRSKT